jgi:ADP-ribose pyrophosphatase YjhB (NUDIX family)
MCAKLLNRIDPTRPLGTALFNAIARLSVNRAFEAVALRVNADVTGLEVYLRRREATDTAYPGMLHVPGSSLRMGERWSDVADRLRREFGITITSFTEVGDLHWDEARGSYESTIFLVEFKNTPREDEYHGWYSVNALPEGVVESHRDRIIPTAVMAYAAAHRLPFRVGATIRIG